MFSDKLLLEVELLANRKIKIVFQKSFDGKIKHYVFYIVSENKKFFFLDSSYYNEIEIFDIHKFFIINNIKFDILDKEDVRSNSLSFKKGWFVLVLDGLSDVELAKILLKCRGTLVEVDK